MNQILLFHLCGIFGLIMAVCCWNIYFSKTIKRKRRIYLYVFLGTCALFASLLLFGTSLKELGISSLIFAIAFLLGLFFLHSVWEVEDKPTRGFRHLSGF